ncbi:hypothetical protein N9H19_00890 [Flavobacteriales bacterium]|nr:hypothetical protein [Flavobacteriales bacterium]
MIKEIIDGYKNYFNGGNHTTLLIAKKRAKVCSYCPFAKKGFHSALLPDMNIKEIKGLYCGICKCPLSPKVRSKDSKCPKNKW